MGAMVDRLADKLKLYDFEKLFAKKGYAYFKRGAYNLNIIGIRTNHKKKVTNAFDDYLIVIYNTEDGKTHKVIYDITTEPGLYYMKNLGNKKGTAILVPKQYRSTWAIGLHRGKYKALCQLKPVAVYRDGNKDNMYDCRPETIDNGIFGINIHRAGTYSTTKAVDKYSAGCQVFADPRQFASFMRLCEEQKARYGNTFTYTLIEENDL